MPERFGAQMFRSPEREQMKHEPIVRFSRTEIVNDLETGTQKEVEKKYVAVAGVELEIYDGQEGSSFRDDEFDQFSLDESSLDILKRYAVGARLNQPTLIEGETDIGKTKSVEYLAHLTNHRLFRLSLSGQTDVTEFIGKYVPNTSDARVTFEKILRSREKLSKASQTILDNLESETGLRGLTEDECRVIAKNEGLAFSEGVHWVWQDGIIPTAMMHAGGRGAWLYLDELGTSEPQVLVRINRLFEKVMRLELSENGNRMVEAGPDFRIFASTNPPEYSGRLPLAPDALRRWTFHKMESLPAHVLGDRLMAIFAGEQPLVSKALQGVSLVEHAPFDFKDRKELARVILAEFLPEFFKQVRNAVKDGTVGRDQRQQVRIEASDTMRLCEYLLAFGGDDPASVLREAARFYFANKFGAEKDRVEVLKIFDAVFRAKATGKKIQEARAPRREASEPPELAAARQEAERAIAELAAIEGGSSPESGDLTVRVRELAAALDAHIKHRFSEQGRLETITIDPPELPPGLTQAHLEAVREALGQGKGFEERVLPTLNDLHNLDEVYVSTMYPETQSETDKTRGLISHRSNWWTQEADSAFTASKKTWGEVYLRSMRKELETLGGSLIQLDTAVKPKYTDGKQQYGAIEGTDSSADPLLPLFQEVFGPDANRFSHTWDDIETKLLPLAKQKIADALRARGVSPVNFDVILVPATLDNLEMTFHHPESSSTNTYEWTSTTLLDDSGTDTGRRLSVGDSGYGGAGGIGRDARGRSFGDLGARLAVVWKK